MKRVTWRKYGYLEGLRKQRNLIRTMAKTSKLMNGEDSPAYQQANYIKIQIEKHYTEERDRMCKNDKELKKAITHLHLHPNNIIDKGLDMNIQPPEFDVVSEGYMPYDQKLDPVSSEHLDVIEKLKEENPKLLLYGNGSIYDTEAHDWIKLVVKE